MNKTSLQESFCGLFNEAQAYKPNYWQYKAGLQNGE
jgi:hypothetical protein